MRRGLKDGAEEEEEDGDRGSSSLLSHTCGSLSHTCASPHTHPSNPDQRERRQSDLSSISLARLASSSASLAGAGEGQGVTGGASDVSYAALLTDADTSFLLAVGPALLSLSLSRSRPLSLSPSLALALSRARSLSVMCVLEQEALRSKRLYGGSKER